MVSSNEIEDLSPVRALKSLTKLSASHCGVVVIPDVADLHELAELRLNDNKIVSLPESLQFNYNLKTLELGNNRICKYRYGGWELRHMRRKAGGMRVRDEQLAYTHVWDRASVLLQWQQNIGLPSFKHPRPSSLAPSSGIGAHETTVLRAHGIMSQGY